VKKMLAKYPAEVLQANNGTNQTFFILENLNKKKTIKTEKIRFLPYL
jgi:hypothetical protein